MDIIIPAIGSSGDVIPVLTLGKALFDRGHQVTVLANQVFQDRVHQSGLNYIPIGDKLAYQNVTSNPDLWHPQKAFQLIARDFILPGIQPVMEAVRQFDPQKTLILACGFCFGARLAQEKWGYRTLTVHLQPTLLQSAIQPPRLGGLSIPDWFPVPLTRVALGSIDRFITDPILAPEINRLRAELFLQPVNKIFSHWMHSLEGVIGLFPDWFAAPQPDWPANTELTGFIGSSDSEFEFPDFLTDFLAMGEAPILFTPGTSMQFAHHFFEQSIDACRRLGCRGLFLTQDDSQIPMDLPDTILHVPYVPFQMLLPKCLAIVYHGGIGTLAQALSAGIPQLIVPFSHDQPDNAARIRALGVGDCISPSRYKGKLAAKKLGDLIDSGDVAVVTRMLSSWVNFTESLKETCQIIENHLPD